MKRLSCLTLVVFFLLYVTGCGLKSHHVQISSEPKGAEVFYENTLLGETPLQNTVYQKEGDFNFYVFRAEKEEYIPIEKIFKEQFFRHSVVDAVPEQVHFVMVKRKKYNIHITSNPSGAQLIFNGRVIGITPLTVTVMEHIGTARVFKFTVKKVGFQDSVKVLKEYIPKENEEPFQFPESIHFDL